MSETNLPELKDSKTQAAPTTTPQALAWHDRSLWMSSRDLRRIYQIDPQTWTLRAQYETPGIPWAAVSTGDSLWFTLGEGEEDDRYLRRFVPGQGFTESDRIACPELTGSYLSYDGKHLFLSQWYQHRILELDKRGEILREIPIGAEICGHVFVNGVFYVLRGTEQGDESWRLACVDARGKDIEIKDLARVPFRARSLTFDCTRFWSNHRAADETVSFLLP
ncbi:MAG: hypothetical protein ACR2NX_09290 [Chthoniobacterales bacterium]